MDEEVVRKIMWYKRTFLGFCTAYIFVFFSPWQIFNPHVEILFFINHYFLVCIFKCRKSSCKFHWYFNFNSGLEVYWHRILLHNIRFSSNITKKWTATPTKEGGRGVWSIDTAFKPSATPILLLNFLSD